MKRELQRLRLRVTAAAETQLRAGHPWVYGDSIREQNRDGAIGELAVIYDRKDTFLAVGLFDPGSPIRVRILHAGKPQTIDNAWWAARLAQAVERRRGLFDEHTNGYRVINGESDGWPGLVLDRYDETFALKLYTAAWLPRFEEISNLIRAQLKPKRLVLRLSRNIQAAAREKISAEDGQVLFGDRTSPVFLESGIRLEADVYHGQKTGFFLDQRENRRAVESLAGGRNVLNAFSFSGGFSLYAARGGATSVTDLDISAHALASAQRNFALNQSNATIARCRHELAQADTFDWLAANGSRQFDLIILDPPSFAKREAERAGAIRAYEKLAGLGIQHLTRGSILVACSCSAHVTAEEFFDAVRRSAGKSARAFQEIQTTRHAPDHPATFKEAEYLKAIYLRF
ncbi:MAG TPA: class I SAM-dependent methyltransferase [Verrucomicrobiae bacterium]